MTGGMSLGQTSPCMNAFASGQAAAYKMFETIERKSKIDPYDTSGMVLEDLDGEVELRDVYFRYPARPEVQIFSGFSLQVPSGTTTALVGQSGSGKSTVVSLVERFYDPDSGEVLIDGVDLKKLKLSWIREKIGLVSQEPILFATTIKENIGYGKENATDQEIRTAIQLANAAKFIDKMPEVNRFLSRNVYIGSHEELTKDPEGAYSQLIRLQGGAMDSEESQDIDPDMPRSSLDRDKSISSSRSQRHSVQRSISRGSSGSRRSFTLNTIGFGLPGPTSVRDDEFEQNIERNAKPKEVSIRRLAYLNKPELPVLFLGTIAALIHGVIFPVFGLLLSKAINMFYEPPKEIRKDSKFWAVLYLGLGFVTLVVHQEISWFDDPTNSSGAIGARLSTDASTVRRLVGDSLSLIVQNISTILSALVIAFSANWMLTLIIIAISPLLFIQGYMQAKFMKGFSADSKMMYEQASQVANDAVGSIRTVASFCAEKKVMELYQKKCEGPTKQGVRLGFVSGLGYGLSFFILYSTNAFCFYIGAILVQHGKTTFADVFRVFFALTIGAMGVSQSSGLAPDTATAKDSAASIFAILDRKPKIDSSRDEGITLPHVNGDIEIEHVSFKYPMRPHVQIFRDLSLSIPSGKTVALVGESGSGKSTVISLIERFYDPDSGHVYLDSVEIRKFKLNWLRQQMGLITGGAYASLVALHMSAT
ncbi:hypothetical protein OIU84_024748 [Salix udensis]|uniref:Uncharacterized protein n=1 Tax=Salix udensis TaxID=889485 RepID=A0AAD6PCB1_9ROSI|nr:hypothetical protein OIU84_024748 [Salix udensis]